MATKDRKKLQHIHSSIADKQPTPQSLEVGEIAVNNSAKKEFLSIKNSNDKVVRFSSDSTIIDWIEKKEVMPYSGVVDNVHLDTNRSNIEIKINQVAAKNTPKYDKINGAVDIDGQPVNPSTEGGKEDGAGIAIDMSRYAMIGANPSFSSVTVTHRSNLSGTTNISNGASGEVLNITTTNVNANDTNWTETITNKKSNVTSAYTSATTATTIIGTANTSATTATLSGNTLDITEATRLSAKTPSTYVSGTSLSVVETNTDITSCGRISANTNDFEVKQCAANGKFIVNSDDADVSGKTLDIIENTSVTVKTPATTVSGATLVADEGTSISAKTPTAYLSGTTLDVKETNTDIQSCGRISANTNAFTIQECATGSGKTVINQTDIKASGKTLSFDETTSISAKTPTTQLSGTNLNVTETTSTINSTNTNLTGTNLSISETNTTINSCGKIEVTTDKYTLKQCSTSGGSAEFEFCNGYTVKSNTINLQQCGTAGTINITSQTQNVNGGNLTIRESGATDFSGSTLTATTASNANINVKGNLTEVVTGTTNETHTGPVSITNGSAKTETTTGAITENNKAGYTANTTGDTCLQSTADMNVGGAANTNIGTNCDDSVKANYVNIKAKSGITETANTVTISGTTSASISGATVNVSGNTTNISGATNLNMSGKTVNVDATDIDVDASNNYCLSAATKASIYGKTTNIGVECGGTTATTINISGTTINEGGTTNNNNFTTINNTATTINNKANFNITGTTYISGNTTISGDTTIGGKLYLKPDCTSITSTTVNAGLCEVLDRSAITIEKNTEPSDTRLATVYTIKQNGVAINTIEVAKDQFLQNAEVVKNTSGEWVIRLTWWIYDPDSGTHTTATTDVNASELVKDLTAVNPTDNGTALNHNVSVNAWYDSTSGDMKFSAETTPNMHVGNMYVTGTTSAATVSGTNITASAAIRANNVSASTISATTFTGAMSKKLTWAAGAFTADTTGYNGSADKTITVPTAISHLATRGKLTITHNGLSDTYDPATDKPMTLPHSALSFSYGSVSAKTGSDSYNTSAAKSITIPTSIDDLKNYNGTCVEIPHNVCVTGTITSSGAIYSSDRNLKENIMNVSREEINKASNVLAKSFNFKSDESKSKVYGVIAQEVQEAGLDELVHTDDNGNLGVDYTSLLLLKIAYLEDLCGQMYGRIIKLEDKLNNK